jgi:deazaflavin-dependent oxidoreductase (nitroreductase family)
VSEATLADDLVAWGRVIELETRGRRTGLPRRVAVGYVREPDGSLTISATDPETRWARNLLAEPRCRVRDADGWRDCVARVVEGDEHRAIVTALVLRYGTPSERLGSGPSFRLECTPLAGEPAASRDTA